MADKPVVGFIGTGVMGKSMASHIKKGGHELLVYNRTKGKAEELLNQGAVWCNTVAELAEKSDVIITIVGYPHDVEEIYLGEEGILAHVRQGANLIDMTTSNPQLSKKIYDVAKDKGVGCLDAPVSGGDIGAKEARLAIMVGGDEDTFKEVYPILSLMGQNIQHQGPAGSGQYTKMANQIAIASTMMGVAESLAYAKKAGLDQKKVLDSISTGAAGSFSLSNLGPRMIDGNFEPGFYIKHFIKDMKIALESAETMGLHTPGLALAKKLYEELTEKGEDDSGTHAIYKYYINQ
ncbi:MULTISPECIES: NAD(P)-dependent oxidoreductase [Bacillaceae]|uniref:NAD(P)-dependent oxidoreductase n=1 Tax=Evansella alkalicola TaxID=745819 RepID=A0ABS6K0B1_9BACI|nr:MULTISPECIES: NAD(P)-dependent oxidoreductase [Bacillaceae]MBU9724288.1 NAD(P)-dependent oxidoreductase [Bacillus alkalicola]